LNDNTMTTDTTDHEATCPICWLARELAFAADEYHGIVPSEMYPGFCALSGRHWAILDIAIQCRHDDHPKKVNGADIQEAAADVAEFFACFRDNTLTPTRPNVIAQLEPAR
jgi:hypothetical protein